MSNPGKSLPFTSHSRAKQSSSSFHGSVVNIETLGLFIVFHYNFYSFLIDRFLPLLSNSGYSGSGRELLVVYFSSVPICWCSCIVNFAPFAWPNGGGGVGMGFCLVSGQPFYPTLLPVSRISPSWDEGRKKKLERKGDSFLCLQLAILHRHRFSCFLLNSS